MKPFGKSVLTSVLTFTACGSLLAGCGGGGHSTLPAAPVTTSDNHGPLASATFKITIPPPPTTTSKTRRPAYVSTSTSQVVFTLNTDTVGLTGATLATFNTTVLGSKAVTLGSATCPGSGPWTCTLTIQLPPGSDNVTMSAQDSSSHVLSQQIQTFAVTVATNNLFSVTLDANAATMTITGAGFCAVGSVTNGSTFGSVGTQTANFTVAYTDPAGQTIRAPGLPTLSVNGHTDDNGGAGYTITGTGGNVNVKVTQASQTYTLTPTTSATSATINVSSTQANSTGSSDGLSFTNNLSYTFQTGTAPPAHNFLAAIEQTGATGKIDLFNLTLGGNAPNSDSFSSFSPATLAVTGSTNQPGVSDVDNPLSIAWDVNGDLLVANGGSGAAADPNGNFACVPVGSIATGSAQSTTVTTNVDVPESLAYGPHGTVGLADSAGTTIAFSEYLLTGDYVAADSGATGPGTPNLTHSEESNDGGTFTVALPTLSPTTDTFAVALFGGSTPKVTIVTSSGTTTDITNTNITHPVGLAWDPTNSELVVANNDVPQSFVLIYTLSPVTLQQSINTSGDNYYVAASQDGHLAVATSQFSGSTVVHIYSNAPTGRTLLSTIPFDTTTTSGGATYIYNPGTVTSMSWVSNSKLLISLNARNTPANNGLYIFDITASQSYPGFEDVTGNPPPNGPQQTGFQPITNQPLGTAYKP
jgi:hypothetical protein